MVTTDKALIFSAVALIVFTICCKVEEFMGLVPNDTLTLAFFAAFGVAEGGYCAYIYKKKKEKEDDDIS